MDPLVQRIERQRLLVDRHLTRPARWRGLLRRELAGHIDPAARAAYEEAFNSLTLLAGQQARLDASLLLNLYNQAIGDGGFRGGPVSVGRGPLAIERPSATEIPELVDTALARSTDEVEPVALAAARLHLELLLIHPFPDGNGRVARLASSYVLMRGGYRSTLLTAVEQHFAHDPGAYLRSFEQLATSVGGHKPWLTQALVAMAKISAKVSFLRDRETTIRDGLASLGVRAKAIDGALVTFDIGRGSPGEASAQLAREIPPWSRLVPLLEPDAAGQLAHQLRRVLDEEHDERLPRSTA